ncbi:unnamed protein product [Ixodes pacificus]
MWYVRAGRGVRSPFILPTKTTASEIAPAPWLVYPACSAGQSAILHRHE